jgi:hypothetical protein
MLQSEICSALSANHDERETEATEQEPVRVARSYVNSARTEAKRWEHKS